MSLAVFCDFDGTVTLEDTCVALVSRFAADLDWRAIEADWQNGTLSTADAANIYLRSIRAGREEVLAWLDRIPVDARFAAFVARCRARGDNLTILSDGYDAIIRHFLTREGLDLPVFANHLVWRDGRMEAEFPEAAPTCTRCGCCKRSLIGRLSAGRETVLIGDGRSDLCAAGVADHVFAKGLLPELCREAGIPCIPWNDFADILAHPLFRET